MVGCPTKMIPISEAAGNLSYIPPVLRKKLTTLPLYFYCYDILVLANVDGTLTFAINTSIYVNSGRSGISPLWQQRLQINTTAIYAQI
jgi:hypothetical protein